MKQRTEFVMVAIYLITPNMRMILHINKGARTAYVGNYVP